MNPKILETWINDTLVDAEHLDIPGIMLKPAHKNPISRYGIDRITLNKAGIPNDTVDRIYRALFVYSIGFFELMKNCLEHSAKNYILVTSIWKVFAVLLEYCCKSDYKMLISKISIEHKREMDKLEHEFTERCEELLKSEKSLKETIELQDEKLKLLETELESENEKRLKLEADVAENAKSHEEEV